MSQSVKSLQSICAEVVRITWTEIEVENDSKVRDDLLGAYVRRRKELFKPRLNKCICKIKSLVRNNHDATVTIEDANDQNQFFCIYYDPRSQNRRPTVTHFGQ